MAETEKVFQVRFLRYATAISTGVFRRNGLPG